MDDNKEIQKRIQMIKSYIGAKSNGEFTEIVKMRPQHYSAQMQENGRVGETMLLKILVNIPEISPRWLLYGEGEMLREGMAKDGGEADARTIEALHSDLEEFRAQAAAAREERRFFMQQIMELKKTAAPQVCAASCAAAG